MDNKQFNIRIRPLNLEYRAIFGYIPCITDYSCSREDYLYALQKAVAEHQELSAYLEKVFTPMNVET